MALSMFSYAELASRRGRASCPTLRKNACAASEASIPQCRFELREDQAELHEREAACSFGRILQTEPRDVGPGGIYE
jgi:hypothetical protein